MRYASHPVDSLEACLILVSLIWSGFDTFRISVELNVLILTRSSALNRFWTIPAEVYGRLAVSFACFYVKLFAWQMSGVRGQCSCDRQNEPLWQLYYIPCRNALIYNVFIMLLFGYH